MADFLPPHYTESKTVFPGCQIFPASVPLIPFLLVRGGSLEARNNDSALGQCLIDDTVRSDSDRFNLRPGTIAVPCILVKMLVIGDP